MAGYAATLQPILRGDIGMMMMIYYVQWENACLQLCLIIESLSMTPNTNGTPSLVDVKWEPNWARRCAGEFLRLRLRGLLNLPISRVAVAGWVRWCCFSLLLCTQKQEREQKSLPPDLPTMTSPIFVMFHWIGRKLLMFHWIRSKLLMCCLWCLESFSVELGWF